MSTLRLPFVLILLAASTTAGAQPQVLDYRFSFGNSLVVTNEPRRVVLSIENVFGAPVACGLATLLDVPRGNSIFSRVRFRIVPGQDGCLGGSCGAVVGPPPTASIWTSVGPFEAGETKTCAFDVSLAEPISGSILLTGSAGPVEVLASADAHAVPGLRMGMVALLAVIFAAMGAFGFSRARRF